MKRPPRQPKHIPLRAVFLFAAALSAGYGAASTPAATGQTQDAFAPAVKAPLTYYKVIEERDVFRGQNELKTPAAAASPVEAALTALEKQSRPVADFIVTGIMKIRDRFKAIIERRDGSQSSYVQVGDDVNDYTVTAIDPTGVSLEKNGLALHVRLDTKEGPAPAPAPAPAPEATPATGEAADAARAPQAAPTPLIQKIRMGQGGSR